MSSRHRSQELAAPDRTELRAHARGERHRISSELHAVANQVASGLEPDDTHEPGAAWKPVHRHDPERAKAQLRPTRLRHWKLKAWKRRTTARRAKAQAMRIALDEG
jgi:hypothetical protein